MTRLGKIYLPVLLLVILCLLYSSGVSEQAVSGQQYPKYYKIGGADYEVQNDSTSDLLYVERDDHIEILQYVGFSSTVTIPDKINDKPVTVVGLSACRNYGLGQYFKGVRKVVLPSTIVKLSSDAFSGLECLQVVEGLENVQELEKDAFENSFLPEAHFSAKLKTVGQHAFSRNYLEKVTIPDDIPIENVHQQFMFSGLLESLTLIRGTGDPTIKLVGDALMSADGKKLLRLMPWHSEQTYVIPEGTEVIAWDAFFSLVRTEEYFFPDSINEIENVNFSPIKVNVVATKDSYTWKYFSEHDTSGEVNLVETDKSVKLKAQEIVAEVVKPEMNQWEKAFALHNWVLEHTEYDRTYTHGKARDVFFEGTATCDGYSRAFGVLLDEAGIENDRVECILQGEPHAINAVKLNGEWVYVDCTNDDGSTFGAPYYLFGFNQRIFKAFYNGSGKTGASNSLTQYAPFIKGDLEKLQKEITSAIEEKIKNNEINFTLSDLNTESKFHALAVSEIMESLTWSVGENSCTILCDAVLNNTGYQYAISVVSGDGSDYLYKSVDKGICLICYLGNESAVSVPASIGGKKVVALEETFQDRQEITKVTLPKGLNEIGKASFKNCSNLEEINFPGTLKKIGEEAFYGCRALSSDIILQKGVTEIGAGAFQTCLNISKAVIPSTVTTLGDGAFYYCQKLSHVTIREGIKSLPRVIFAYCSNLSGILLPESLEVIGEGALMLSGITTINIPENVNNIDCTAFLSAKHLKSLTVAEKNESYMAKENMLLSKDGKKLVCGTRGVNQNLVIPDGVEVIGTGAFLFVPLKTITIPASVRVIEAYAFAGENTYTSVTMADGVEEIGDYAFGAGILVGNSFYQDGSEYNHLKTIRLSNNLKKLGSHVFYGTRLKSLRLPSSLTEIPPIINKPLRLYIPASITTIAEQELNGTLGEIFEICGSPGSAAETYAIAHNVAFYSDVTIGFPETNLFIMVGESAPLLLSLNNGTPVNAAEVEWTVEGESITLADGTVTGVAKGSTPVTAKWNGQEASCTVHVADSEYLHFYDPTNNMMIPNGEGEGYVLLPEQIYDLRLETGIPSYYGGLTLNITDHAVWSVSDETVLELLYPCAIKVLRAGKVTLSATLPDGVIYTWNLIAVASDPKEIPPLEPDEPEPENPDLEEEETEQDDPENPDNPENPETPDQPEPTSATIENGIYEITGKEAVFIAPAKKNLKKLMIQDKVTIGKKTYKVTAIAENACNGMKRLASVTIGKYVKSIGKNAFNGCKALNTVSGGTAVTIIGDGSFALCSKLASVPAFSKLQTIGKNAFNQCAALKEITLQKNVKSIGAGAFGNCKALTKITVKTVKLTNKNVGKNAFAGTPSKVVVKVPKAQLKAYTKLFRSKGLSKKATVNK